MKIDFDKLLNHPEGVNGFVSHLHFPTSIAIEVFEALTERAIHWASGNELVSGWHEIYGDMASDDESVDISFWKAGDEFEVCYRLYKDAFLSVAKTMPSGRFILTESPSRNTTAKRFSPTCQPTRYSVCATQSQACLILRSPTTH